MNQEAIRQKIVRLSKELAEETDYNRVKKLRRQIALLKGLYVSSDPKSLGELMTGK